MHEPSKTTDRKLMKERHKKQTVGHLVVLLPAAVAAAAVVAAK
jgi:hypothetical protein